MGVQSRRRQQQKIDKPPQPHEQLTKDEQTERYFANWVDGHPRPDYKQTNVGGYAGPKTAPKGTGARVRPAGTPLLERLAQRFPWWLSMRRKTKSLKTARR